MQKFLFSSCRGKDFEATGETPEEAYQNLVLAEFDSGRLRRLNDAFRNTTAVNKQGFTFFDVNSPEKGAYKKL